MTRNLEIIGARGHFRVTAFLRLAAVGAFLLCVQAAGNAGAQAGAGGEAFREMAPHLLMVPGAVDLVVPAGQSSDSTIAARMMFPEAAEDFTRRSRIEEFQSEGGIPLPFGDAVSNHYVRYSFHKGWLDLGLMRTGILVKPVTDKSAGEEAPVVVIYHRAFQLRIEPSLGASVQAIHFSGQPENYGYVLLRVREPVRVTALPDPDVLRHVTFRFFAVFGAVVLWSLLTGLLFRARRISEEVARAGNLLVLLTLLYFLFVALGSENVLAIAYYGAGRVAIPAVFVLFGLAYIVSRWAHYPAVRVRMPIPFFEYAGQVLRQTFLVTAPILIYLTIDSFVDSFWVSLVAFGLFFVVVTLVSPLTVKWLFRGRPMNAEARQAIEQYCRQSGVRIRHFYEYTPRYTFSPNAFVAGVFPFNRALFVSTHLLEFLSPDERASVMSHELAHARFHHPFWLFALTLGYLSAAGGLVSLLPDRYASFFIGGVVGGGALLFFAVSRAFERQADRAAAAEYGEVYLSAMEKLYSTAPEAQATRLEVLLTHPSQQRRFEAIRKWISSAALKSS